MKNRLIVFTGGGTAGHVFPAFPVISRLKSRGIQVIWIGSSKGVERGWIEKEGLSFYGVPSGKFRRYFSLKNLTDLFRIFGGFVSSLFFLIRQKPSLVFSKGGFVSVPPVAAARLLGIPVYTHESDVDPGLATRLNLKLGASALLTYEETKEFLPASALQRASVTGNPVRDIIFQGNAAAGRRLAGIAPDDARPLVLVFGGSQGAREINDLITAVLDDLLQIAAVVHQRGPGNPGIADRPGYMSRTFFAEELPHLLAAADVSVARSGAGSLWELAATGTPALFVPLRGATRGDQLRNAALAEKAGMSLTLKENAGPREFLEQLKQLLLDEECRNTMKKAALQFPAAAAADKIAAILGEVLDGGN